MIKVPAGSFPSGETYLALEIISEFSLAFLSMRLNLATVSTLALIFANLSLSYSYFSSYNYSIILLKSTSELYLATSNCYFFIIVFLWSKWSSMSPILSARNGKDQEKRSKPLGKENGCSTSLYYLIFILSSSIKMTAPLFL